MNRAVQSSVVLLFLSIAGCASEGAQSIGRIAPEVALRYSDPCDAQNRRLYIDNHHAFSTFAVTVQWGAAGGKQLTEQTFVAPNDTREVGCAAWAKIIEASPTDF